MIFAVTESVKMNSFSQSDKDKSFIDIIWETKDVIFLCEVFFVPSSEKFICLNEMLPEMVFF